MKKIITLSLLISFATVSFAQDSIQKQAFTQTDYLKRSKNQKKAAWIATGVGTTVLVVTILSVAATPSFPTYGDDEVETVGTIPSVIGLAFIATGAYLFIASGKNKRKAKGASVFIDIENAPALHQAMIRNESFPIIGVRIRL